VLFTLRKIVIVESSSDLYEFESSSGVYERRKKL